MHVPAAGAVRTAASRSTVWAGRTLCRSSCPSRGPKGPTTGDANAASNIDPDRTTVSREDGRYCLSRCRVSLFFERIDRHAQHVPQLFPVTPPIVYLIGVQATV